jgi:hypothetical protein
MILISGNFGSASAIRVRHYGELPLPPLRPEVQAARCLGANPIKLFLFVVENKLERFQTGLIFAVKARVHVYKTLYE